MVPQVYSAFSHNNKRDIERYLHITSGGTGYHDGDIIKIKTQDIKPNYSRSEANFATHTDSTGIVFNEDLEFTLHVKSADAKQVTTAQVVHKHVVTAADDAHAINSSEGWAVGDEFYILPHSKEKVYDNPAERINLARILASTKSKQYAVGRVDNVTVQAGTVDPATGTYWYKSPLHPNGAVISWTLIDPGYADYSSGREQARKANYSRPR